MEKGQGGGEEREAEQGGKDRQRGGRNKKREGRIPGRKEGRQTGSVGGTGRMEGDRQR